jgi:hypothetical protein
MVGGVSSLCKAFSLISTVLDASERGNMAARQPLFVALGQQRYQVERPWGDIPSGA